MALVFFCLHVTMSQSTIARVHNSASTCHVHTCTLSLLHSWARVQHWTPRHIGTLVTLAAMHRQYDPLPYPSWTHLLMITMPRTSHLVLCRYPAVTVPSTVDQHLCVWPQSWPYAPHCTVSTQHQSYVEWRLVDAYNPRISMWSFAQPLDPIQMIYSSWYQLLEISHMWRSSANLHIVERRLDVPRRTCTITDDNGDMIFVEEVQPKPTSPGQDYGRSSPIPQHQSLRGLGIVPPPPCEPVAMSSWLQ